MNKYNYISYIKELNTNIYGLHKLHISLQLTFSRTRSPLAQ